MDHIIKDMAKFKSDLLNKLADKKAKPNERARKPKTLYLNGENFEIFKKILKPVSPSEAFDEYMIRTIESETKKKS